MHYDINDKTGISTVTMKTVVRHGRKVAPPPAADPIVQARDLFARALANGRPIHIFRPDPAKRTSALHRIEREVLRLRRKALRDAGHVDVPVIYVNPEDY